ncbi:antibiotic biosynthesis monooxygenase [Bacillus sp. S/N-304-OC-R1]|uniref:antibiotic biosynthesis monooxygenase family protein n=1 Tax=Bacillus sp. S/N-304-OC-R1 TaxID=2758034 RepID=UPI001C8D1F5B|nr:antibiotic biosynthesis monooxygenase [Bacillus sp. S/N-304-OC-R1]MBY0121621.1 antibiotic biosynthesis monooxygenase [Bacillus sp. S/N-304-OC-R1]
MSVNTKEFKESYFVVIFSSQRSEGENGYGKMAQVMEDLASRQQGFLGIESVRDNELGITISYWESLEDIKRWKENTAHKAAQIKGKKEWYKNYKVRKMEREYSFER